MVVVDQLSARLQQAQLMPQQYSDDDVDGDEARDEAGLSDGNSQDSQDSQDIEVILQRSSECLFNGCDAMSFVAKYDSMSLRMGFPMCMSHVDTAEMRRSLATVDKNVNMQKTSFVFYDLKTSYPHSNDVTQIGAVSDAGAEFEQYVTSPFEGIRDKFLSSYPSRSLKNWLIEPGLAFALFMEWLVKTHDERHGRDSPLDSLILVAQYGACFDHMHLVRSCRKYQVLMPKCRVADTVLICKILEGLRTDCKLITLVSSCAPTFLEDLGDARTAALALCKVMRCIDPHWRDLIWSSSTPLCDYVTRLGFSARKTVA